MHHNHVRVPGFGCTYVKELEHSVGAGAIFSLQFVKKDDFRTFFTDGPTLMFPLEAGRAKLTVGKSVLSLDFNDFLLIPSGSKCAFESQVPILKIAYIDFSDETSGRMLTEFELDQKKVKSAFEKTKIMRRSSWINELCHRYIFERSIADQPTSGSAQFLEMELLKEAYYASVRSVQEQKSSEPRFAQLPMTLQRALQFLEENLFEAIDLDLLAKVAITSRPTLLRNFKARLGVSPIKYVWSRRLQEASQLLATGQYTVAEVSEIVGYSDVSSFSHAYREHFGFSPSVQMK